MSVNKLREVIEVAEELYERASYSPMPPDTDGWAIMAEELLKNRPRMAYIQSMAGSARAGFENAAYKLLESALSVYKWSGGE